MGINNRLQICIQRIEDINCFSMRCYSEFDVTEKFFNLYNHVQLM